jgi:hypothetical protein
MEVVLNVYVLFKRGNSNNFILDVFDTYDAAFEGRVKLAEIYGDLGWHFIIEKHTLRKQS